MIRTSRRVTLAALGKFDEGERMTKRIQKLFLTVAALGALAVGASTIASAQQQPAKPQAPATQSAPSTEPTGGPDTDTIQSGDQTTPDTAGASAAATKSPTAGTKQEAPGTEQPDASEPAGANETPDANEAPGSESAANSDGPGGHADEPGNASADNQFEGQQ
jgi:hypothetical protein